VSTTDALREALKAHRETRGLSYDALAQQINEFCDPPHSVTLFSVRKFIEGFTSYPHVLTLEAIEKYLKNEGVEVAA
jgi:hypothetical protein